MYAGNVNEVIDGIEGISNKETEHKGGVLLSIIVPVYNTEKYLRDCLDSLLAQGLDENSYEILCIDDGSTDGCPYILDGYGIKHEQIKVLHQKNKGVSAARNMGLDIAVGKYVAFVDSDDFVKRNAYGLLCKEAEVLNAEYIKFSYQRVEEEYCLSRADSVFTTAVKRNETGVPVSSSNMYSILIKNSIIQNHQIRFNEEQRYGEDTLVNFFLTLFVKPEHQYVCEEKIYCYRQRQGSAMHSANKSMYHVKDMFIMIDSFKKVLETWELSEWQKNNIKDRMFLCTAAAIFSSMRISREKAVDTKEKLEILGLYPYPFMPYIIKRKVSLGNFLMLILKWPMVFGILNKLGLLLKKGS